MSFFSRHGNNCAGVIAAVLNNSNCGVGLAYNARLGGMVHCMSRITLNYTCTFMNMYPKSYTMNNR